PAARADATGFLQAHDLRRAACRGDERFLRREAALGKERRLHREAVVPRERRTSVGAGRDPHPRLVGHPQALAVTFGDRAGPLDDYRIERVRMLEEGMDHEKRGNDRHVALLDESNSLLVEKRSEERRVGKECRSRWWR